MMWVEATSKSYLSLIYVIPGTKMNVDAISFKAKVTSSLSRLSNIGSSIDENGPNFLRHSQPRPVGSLEKET